MSMSIIRIVGVIIGGTIGGYVSGKIGEYIYNKKTPRIDDNVEITQVPVSSFDHDGKIKNFEDLFNRDIEQLKNNPLKNNPLENNPLYVQTFNKTDIYKNIISNTSQNKNEKNNKNEMLFINDSIYDNDYYDYILLTAR